MYSITDNLYMNIAYRLTVSNADKLSADMCIDCRQICRQSIRNTVDCQYHYAGTVNM